MKDRLIELIINGVVKFSVSTVECPIYEYIADHLLANGVIVPPVSIGDSLWKISYNKPQEWKVVYIGFNGEEWHINVYWHKDKDNFKTIEVDGKYLDRMFFRTKEEAERHIKEWSAL